MNQYGIFFKLKGWDFNPSFSTPLYKRHGSKWTEKEDSDLVQLILQGKLLENIANIHHRTQNSILTRLVKLRWRYNEYYNQINDFLIKNDINSYRRKKYV